MALLLATSLPYKIGELTALVLLAVLFVALVRRALRPRPRALAPIVAPAPGAQLPPIASMPPPGFAAALPAPTPPVHRDAAPPRTGRRRTGDAIAAIVVGAVLVVAVLNAIHTESPKGPWATGSGRDMKAGFVDGCRASDAGLVDCECAFARLTSQPPYNTPAGLETLAGPVQEYMRTHDARVLPAVFVSSFLSCRKSTS